jgi:hypothetical protein
VQGGPVGYPARGVRDVRLKKGVLILRAVPVGANPGDEPDEYRIDFSDVANRRLFLHLLRELYGFDLD